MRLTNSDRDAFIQAVIDDVPQTNYDEEARSKIQAWAVARIPEVMRIAYEKHPAYFENRWHRTPGCLATVYAVSADNDTNIQEIDPAFYSELVELASLKSEQQRRERELRQQLKGVIYSCTTLKKAEELLPEFKKYLPADRDGNTNRSMPVISNLVATLTQAGWPKDQPLAQGA